MTDVFSKKQRSRIMSRIKSRGTKIERDFQRRYPQAVSHPKLPFNPDFAILDMVIFLDSPFWHCRIPRVKFDKLSRWWQDKLMNNLIRDISATVFYGGLCVRIDNKLVDKLMETMLGDLND